MKMLPSCQIALAGCQADPGLSWSFQSTVGQYALSYSDPFTPTPPPSDNQGNQQERTVLLQVRPVAPHWVSSTF